MRFICGFVCVLKYQFAVHIGHRSDELVVVKGRRFLRHISVDKHSDIVRFAQAAASGVACELVHLALRETDVELGVSVSRNYRSFHRRFCSGVIGAVPLQSITLRRRRSIARGGWLYKAIARYSIRQLFLYVSFHSALPSKVHVICFVDWYLRMVSPYEACRLIWHIEIVMIKSAFVVE